MNLGRRIASGRCGERGVRWGPGPPECGGRARKGSERGRGQIGIDLKPQHRFRPRRLVRMRTAALHGPRGAP